MADEAAALELKKRRTFRKFTYRGVDLDKLLDVSHEQLMDMVCLVVRFCTEKCRFGNAIDRYPIVLLV